MDQRVLLKCANCRRHGAGPLLLRDGHRRGAQTGHSGQRGRASLRGPHLHRAPSKRQSLNWMGTTAGRAPMGGTIGAVGSGERVFECAIHPPPPTTPAGRPPTPPAERSLPHSGMVTALFLADLQSLTAIISSSGRGLGPPGLLPWVVSPADVYPSSQCSLSEIPASVRYYLECCRSCVQAPSANSAVD